MRPIPFAHPAAGVIFVIALALLGAVQIRVAAAGMLRRIGPSDAREAGLDRGSLTLLFATTGIGMGAGFVLAADVHAATMSAGIPSVPWLLFVVGIAAIVAGLLARQWAISTLGRFFTLHVRVTDDQQVVTSGPYRWVRHPSYTADILAFVGVGLALGNWLSLLVITVLPLLGFIRRIQVEEASLLTNLGEPYRSFASGKKRLLPGIW